MYKTLLALVLLTPQLALAQAGGIVPSLRNILDFLVSAIIPFLLGIAFLMVVVNVVRFFVIGSTNQDGREKARAFALYSVFAFLLILLFWGIVFVLTNNIGINSQTPPGFDYP